MTLHGTVWFEEPAQVTASWKQHGYPAELAERLRDPWVHLDRGTHSESYSAMVEPHRVVMVRVQP